MPRQKAVFGKNGFTLIELMIVMVIIGVLAGLGMVQYIRFNRTRTLQETAKNLRSTLILARTQALTGEKDANCPSGYNGWYVELNAHDYQIYCRCDGNPAACLRQTTNVASDINITTVGGNKVWFKPFAGVDNLVKITLAWTGVGSVTLKVEPSGNIE